MIFFWKGERQRTGKARLDRTISFVDDFNKMRRVLSYYETLSEGTFVFGEGPLFFFFT
jgi:hypothetical protein